MWKLLSKSAEDIEEEQFWKAIDVWNQNPHTVNRRIHSSVTLFHGSLEDEYDSSTLLNINIKEADQLDDNIFETLKKLGLNVCLKDPKKPIQVFVKKLLPRNRDYFKVSLEMVITDRTVKSAYFCSLSSENGTSLIPKFPYKVQHDSAIQIEIPDTQSDSDPSAVWLQTHLLNNLVRWANFSCGSTLKSHSLIPKEKYTCVYQALKKKYAQEMIKIWPECTDPVKFVHEDVAIASYLILLWEGNDPVTFVDLGCGNGLLVHILNSEGHKGLGIDIRERKIWKLYPATTKLEVRSITPSNDSLFPSVEWLVGNHSDELTPWIPVIAARSSLNCNFFVLPCCPYDFDGLRYQRKNTSVSQYSDFLEYVQQISKECGFKTYVDRLRIPSTKRICIVGKERTYCEGFWNTVNNNISKLIESGCRKLEVSDENESARTGEAWIDDFKPRESKEAVRNCTQLERSLIDEIVCLVSDYLLVKRRLISVCKNPERLWNAGGIATIGELVPLIGNEKLKKLKNEFGGLQTLLKNNHQVFLVEKGKVQIRSPISRAEAIKNSNNPAKYKPCWFYHNHPDGCLLSDETCAFVHK